MFDFRLKVFHTAALRMNFTKAAQELHITQPAVTKHIKEVEQSLQTKLFDRNGTKISLTESGKVLLNYTEQLFKLYRELEYEISQLNQQHRGTLRIGASTTIAQYVLPPLLAAFHERFKDIRVTLLINNTEVIEQLLEKKAIDIGITEGNAKNKLFKYTVFLKDELVFVSKSGHPLIGKSYWKVEDLRKLPLLVREPGSGTLEIISDALREKGIHLNELNIEMELGNTESIKSYLLHSECFAFLSVYSVLEELKAGSLTITDVKNLNIERNFLFIQEQGAQSSIAELFVRFALSYNFK